MLAFEFQESGLALVSLTDLGSSLTEQGPNSINSPKADEHPGPPLIHITTGSSEGLDLDSKK